MPTSTRSPSRSAPGLSLCLKVGVLKARALACEHALPAGALSPHGGARAGWRGWVRKRDVRFPFLCLLVSGGHNLLLLGARRRRLRAGALHTAIRFVTKRWAATQCGAQCTGDLTACNWTYHAAAAFPAVGCD